MDIKTAAEGAFYRFRQVWEFKGDGFWRRGNTFHAFLRFNQSVFDSSLWSPTDPFMADLAALWNGMIETNHAYFQKEVGRDYWADDYGWWGIAFLEARRQLLHAGLQTAAEQALEDARACWRIMVKRGYDASYAARPVAHGCANSPSGEKISDCAKNTVTNVNFFVLSLRLYSALLDTDKAGARECLSSAYAQFKWFSAWFQDNYVSLDEGYYLRRLEGGPAGLIHERPMAAPDYKVQDHPSWNKGWVWTGDQGLVLAGLAEIHLIQDDLRAWIETDGVDPDFEPGLFESETLAWFAMIVSGVKTLLFDNDNVLREAPFDASFTSDPTDYVCGRGVLLRYLSEDTVQQVLNRVSKGGSFRTGFDATAAAAWSHADADHQFSAIWGSGDTAFAQRFVRTWGTGNPNASWTTQPAEFGVTQANGLDALAATLFANNR